LRGYWLFDVLCDLERFRLSISLFDCGDSELPYIPKEERKRYDDLINELVSRLPSDITQIDGHLNYIITRILKMVYKPRYFNYNRAIGLLECVKQEFYRVVVSPYEERKRREAGDV